MLKVFWCHLAKMPKYWFWLQLEATAFTDTVCGTKPSFTKVPSSYSKQQGGTNLLR